ncbi:MAG TPA: protein kinase, partial [Steroidobacteraceae bacterium]
GEARVLQAQKSDRVRVAAAAACSFPDHPQGLVHRDIALRNVLLRKSGEAVVADLGLARAVGAGPAGRNVTHEGALLPVRWSAPVSGGQLR